MSGQFCCRANYGWNNSFEIHLILLLEKKFSSRSTFCFYRSSDSQVYSQLVGHLESSDLYIMKHWDTALNSIVWKRNNLMSRKCDLINWIWCNSQPRAAVHQLEKTNKIKAAVLSVRGTAYTVCCLWAELFPGAAALPNYGWRKVCMNLDVSIYFLSTFLGEMVRTKMAKTSGLVLNWPVFKFLPLELNFLSLSSGQSFCFPFLGFSLPGLR